MAPTRQLPGRGAVADVLRQWRRTGREDQIRLVGLDIARCVAVLAMMAAHILPKFVDGRVPWQQTLVAGRASGLFAVLAGTSLALMSGGRTAVVGRARLQASRGLVVRAALITVLGLGLEKLHNNGLGVILPYYGVLFLLGIPFLGLSPRRLLIIATGWAIIVPAICQEIRPHLPDTSGLKQSQMDPFTLATYFGFTGDYPAVPWVAFLLVGIAIGRMNLHRTDLAIRLLISGALLATLSTAVSDVITRQPRVQNALLSTWSGGGDHPSWAALQAAMSAGFSGSTPTGSWWWLTVQAAHSATPFDLLQTTGCALAMIGTSLLITRRFTRFWQIVGGAGAMSLTSYSLHLVMLRSPMWPGLGTAAFWPEAAVVLALGGLFSVFRWRGPLEGFITVCARRAAGRPLR